MSQRVHSAALTVALNARVNSLQPEEVSNLVTLAEELLDRDDPLKPAVTGFAVQWEVSRYDPAALAMQGRILEAKVHEAIGVVKTAPHRADIDD